MKKVINSEFTSLKSGDLMISPNDNATYVILDTIDKLERYKMAWFGDDKDVIRDLTPFRGHLEDGDSILEYENKQY